MYTYDSMGSIATFSAPGKGTVTYTYDNQGQLLKAAGDTTYTYTYGDTDWKDLLTAFDGSSITYDAIGKPTSYYNGTRWTMSWVNGRSLATNHTVIFLSIRSDGGIRDADSYINPF